MIIETRIYNARTNEMVYFPPFRVENFEIIRELGKNLQQYDPVMMYSGMQDINKKKLYVGDIVNVDVKTDFGVIKEKGKIIYNDKYNAFSVGIKKNYGDKNGNISIGNVVLIGNTFQDQELNKFV